MPFLGKHIAVKWANTNGLSLPQVRIIVRMARFILIAVLAFSVLAEPRLCRCDGQSFGFLNCQTCPTKCSFDGAADLCGIPGHLPLRPSCPRGTHCPCESRSEMLGDSTASEEIGRRSVDNHYSGRVFDISFLPEQPAHRKATLYACFERGMEIPSGRQRLLALCLLLC